mmetsp:Transcript_22851/g.41378  ORF Transcript_22851/g.41378 Transcript_22851/m.41378 type:complete len:723 (-) Transcript_22851:47-2215(-)
MVQSMTFPALSAMKLAKLPPLVDPGTLARAAAHCAEFGGNKEALDAAALAGALIEAQLLHAKKAGPSLAPSASSASMLPMTQPMSAQHAPAVEVVSPDVNDQLKQAMAALEATNTQPKEKAPPESVRVVSAPVGPGLDRDAVPQMAPMVSMPPLPGLATGMPPSLTLPGVPSALLQNPLLTGMLPPPVPPMPLPVPPVQPLQTVQPVQSVQQGLPERPPKRELPQMAREAQVAREPTKPQKPPPPKEEVKEKKKPEPVCAPIDDDTAVRCHLHRKPTLNCKICRRVYYSMLDPSYNKKADKKDGSSAHLGHSGLEEDSRPPRQLTEAFEVTNTQTFNFNAMLRDQILKSTYFKSLMNIETFEGLVDELYQFADTAEVYGAGTTTVPTTLFCCLFRFFTIGISYDELQALLNNKDSAYIRCCGFLYIRFGCASEKLWDHLGEYCLDDAEFEPSKSSPSFTITIGEYVEALLMDERYYYTALPRIPVATKKKIEEKVAPLLQFRKRATANKRVLDSFRTPGTAISASIAGSWYDGTVSVLLESIQSRIFVRCKIEGGSEESVPLGKVILRRRGRSRSRSRSRSPRRAHSPDWTRHKGKSDADLVHDLRARQRERAVCSSGKDYARKPIGFMSGLALRRDLGLASSRLREEETYAPRQVERRKEMTEEEEMERRRLERVRQEMDPERQARMQQLYEKYGVANPKEKGSKDAPAAMEEAPEMLRLG